MSNFKKHNFINIILIDKIVFFLPSQANKISSIMFWDSESFRPNLEDFLKNNIKYKISILFSKEHLLNGDIVFFPQKITVFFNNNTKKKFINIR
jgi:hypothetical protein